MGARTKDLRNTFYESPDVFPIKQRTLVKNALRWTDGHNEDFYSKKIILKAVEL